MSNFAVDFDADFVASLEGDEVRVTADGSVITVAVPDMTMGLRLWNNTAPRYKERAALELLDQTLRSLDVNLAIQVAGQTVARVGKAARPGLTSRVLGLGPVEVAALPFLSSWMGGKGKAAV